MIDAGSITNTVEVYASIIGDLNIKTATVGDTHVIPLVRTSQIKAILRFNTSMQLRLSP